MLEGNGPRFRFAIRIDFLFIFLFYDNGKGGCGWIVRRGWLHRMNDSTYFRDTYSLRTLIVSSLV